MVPRYSKWGNFTRPIYACIELSLLFRDRQSTYIPIVFVLQWQSFSHELPRPTTQSTKELYSSPGQFQCSMHHLLNYLYLYCMSNYENKGPWGCESLREKNYFPNHESRLKETLLRYFGVGSKINTRTAGPSKNSVYFVGCHI